MSISAETWLILLIQERNVMKLGNTRIVSLVLQVYLKRNTERVFTRKSETFALQDQRIFVR
jgi:hypothetical protein